MYGMFNNCRNVKEIKLPDNFGIASTSMTYMFQYCIALNNIDSIVSKLNLSSTTSI
jgi:surface protein